MEVSDEDEKQKKAGEEGEEEDEEADAEAEAVSQDMSVSLPAQAAFGDPHSDVLRVLNTVGAFQYEVEAAERGVNPGGAEGAEGATLSEAAAESAAHAFCSRYNLSHKVPLQPFLHSS
jgi:hypothetical protein